MILNVANQTPDQLATVANDFQRPPRSLQMSQWLNELPSINKDFIIIIIIIILVVVVVVYYNPWQ